MAPTIRRGAFAAEARAGYLPTVSGFESNTYNRQSQERLFRGGSQQNEEANNTIGAQLNYEVDLWGRVRNLVRSGEAAAQATAADLANAELGLQVELADDYVQLRGLDAQDRLLRNTVAAYTRAFDLTNARHIGGVASGLDVDRAQAQLSAAKAQINDVAAQRALYEARHRQPGRPARLRLRHRAGLGGGAPDPARARGPTLHSAAAPPRHRRGRAESVRRQPPDRRGQGRLLPDREPGRPKAAGRTAAATTC